MNKHTILCILLLISINAHAGIVEINQNEFMTDFSESFESFDGFYIPYQSETIFEGNATITGDGEWGDNNFLSILNGGWNVETVNNGTVGQLASDGYLYVAIAGQGFVNIDFDISVFSFGGFFSNAKLDQFSIFDFYDTDNILIDSFNVDLPSQSGEMNWAGFDSDIALGSVRISGIDTTIDNLMIRTASEIPEPSTLFLFLAFATLFLSKKTINSLG